MMARICDHCGTAYADDGRCYNCNPGMAKTGTCPDCKQTIDLSGKEPHICKETGAKWDDNKCDWSFLPSKPIEEVLKIYAGGAKKYGRGNYQKGIRYSRVFSAAMRHLWAWWRCEGADKESGLSHLAHAAWNIITLLEYTQDSKYKDFDDRKLAYKFIPIEPATLIHGSNLHGKFCNDGEHDWRYETSYGDTGGVHTKYVCTKCNAYFTKIEPPVSVPFSQTIPQEPLPASITTSTPKKDGEYFYFIKEEGK